MDTHRDCGGLVSGYTVPQGYDDQGALPDERVYICHRCGDYVPERNVCDQPQEHDADGDDELDAAEA